MELFRLVIAFICLLLANLAKCLPGKSPPNIIVILMDDQDWMLGGTEPMSKTKELIKQRNGTIFTNAFVSTPVCCPSRSSILTGKYVHNHGVINNTANGNCCSHQWQQGPEKNTMATYLQDNGYRTFYGGKYLNQYGKKETGGVERVPPGYDRWVALAGNSRYYNYTLSVDGEPRHHSDDYASDYLTDVIAKEAVDFIGSDDGRPFFALIAPPACHSPFTPAPQHSDAFAGRTAPRSPSFNAPPPPGEKHWLLNQGPANSSLPDDIVRRVDHVFRQRWRTLLSVDDLIGNVRTLLESRGMLDGTYVVITSDHGFHLGQFGMPVDKRLPYETDIRVPLVIVGPPGSGKRQIADELVVVSVDLAPTVLAMAGISTPRHMDGASLLPLLEQGARHWRSAFLIEYHGEAGLEDVDPECEQDPDTTLCLKEFACRCQDASNNTYNCVRTLSPTEDSLYCLFFDKDHFVEYYDMDSDPYQLRNLAVCPPITLRESSPSNSVPSFFDSGSSWCFPHKEYLKSIFNFRKCAGSTCFR